GADDYLNKPFSAEELLQRSKNLLLQREHLKKLFTSNYFVSPNKLTQNKVDQDFLEKAEAIVEKNLSNSDLSVEQFCQELTYNRSKVHLKLKALTGKNTSSFIKSIRLRKAARLIKEENLNVNEIAEMTGFGSRETFNKAFKNQFNLTPTDFRKNEEPVPLA
ncbi:MAG: helix-turn-helix domain-containing protein, partial [Flavobacteriales bacterium]|nr:helix-turn-helix domain-containing protein [Flavobacteriales bacterium]